MTRRPPIPGHLLVTLLAFAGCEAAAPEPTPWPSLPTDASFPSIDVPSDLPMALVDGLVGEGLAPDAEDEDADGPGADIGPSADVTPPDTTSKPPIGAQTPGPCQNPAYVPSPEFCNGIDDDCDGVIDDHAPCGDDNPCTMDVCLETSEGCASVFEPMGTPCGANGYCFEGVCYNDLWCGNGDCDSGEDCANCDVDCGECDACGDSVCSATETCTTCEADCGDCGLVCTGTTCDDGNACTLDDACIAGICQPGAATTCDLWTSCKTGSCDPEIGCVYVDKPEGTACGLNMTCSLGVCLEDSLESGDIVISEFMANPDMVTDKNGEWFEVYNTTDAPIDINGWEIQDDKTVHVITASQPVLVPGKGYAVLAKNGNKTENGGVLALYAYEKSSDPPNPTFLINNDLDGISLKAGWTVIDHVNYAVDAGWPIEAGVALQLDPDQFDPMSNDSPFSWCLATSPYGNGDLGTPGSPNSACP